MPASWKYFVVRTINMLIVLFIVVFILSAAYSYGTEKELKARIQRQVRVEIKNMDEEPEEGFEQYRRDRISQLMRKHNLHLPRWKRIFYQSKDVLTLEFGKANDMSSFEGSQRVLDIIMDRLPNTLLLFTTAAFIYTTSGIIIGLKAAQKAGTITDKFLSLFSIMASSMPMWWVGMLAITIFVYELGWFPKPLGRFGLISEMGLLTYIGELLRRMALPLIVIVFVFFGARAWTTRNIVTGILQDDYIMAARAKGVPERKVIYGHTLKTAAPPIITSAVMALITSLGGAMIAEVIFGWPGMGLLLRTAILRYQDIPVLMGASFMIAFVYVLGYYIADLIYGFLDPRIEVGVGAKMR